MPGFPVEQELLAAVLAAPQDDAPRQVMADWLLEQADPVARGHGELITLQCELPRLPYGDERRPVLARRIAALLRTHATAIVQRALPEGIGADQVDAGFARGFVESLATDAHRLEARTACVLLPAIAARTPLRRLELECVVPEDWDTVFADATVARLPELALSGHSVESAPLRALSRGDRGRLEFLAIELHGTTQGEAVATLAAAELPALRELSFGESDLLGGSLAPLLAAPFVRSLRALSLRGRALSGAAPIAAVPFGGLERLSLAFPDLFDHDLDALGELRGLRHLGLDTHHGWETQRAWSIATLVPLLGRLPLLRSLSVGGDGGPDDLARVLAVPGLAQLHEFEVTGDLDDAGALALAGAPYLQGLQRLKLGRARLSRATAVKIFTQLPRLEVLDYRPILRRR